jgi:hypothetical protein
MRIRAIASTPRCCSSRRSRAAPRSATNRSAVGGGTPAPQKNRRRPRRVGRAPRLFGESLRAGQTRLGSGICCRGLFMGSIAPPPVRCDRRQGSRAHSEQVQRVAQALQLTNSRSGRPLPGSEVFQNASSSSVAPLLSDALLRNSLSPGSGSGRGRALFRRIHTSACTRASDVD